MCGICGIASTRGAVDPGRLAAMSATLVQRGPDSDGTYVDNRVGIAAVHLVPLSLRHYLDGNIEGVRAMHAPDLG